MSIMRYIPLFTLKKSWSILFVLLNLSSWSYMATTLIGKVSSEANLTSGELSGSISVYYFAVLVSALLAGYLAGWNTNSRHLLIWTIVGGTSSLLPMIVGSDFAVEGTVLTSFLLGASSGSILPSCLAIFSEETAIEERGRMAAVVLLLTFAIFSCFTGICPLLSIEHASLCCALWRYASLLPLFRLKNRRADSKTTGYPSYRSIVTDSSFLRYAIPCFLFALADVSTQHLIANSELGIGIDFLLKVEIALAIIFTLVAGLLLDFVGRKTMIMVAFAIMGIGYALLSFGHRFPYIWLVYTILDGTAWTVLTLVFMIVLWGDLSGSRGAERYYALGLSPLFMAGALRFQFQTATSSLSLENAFSVVSFLLFLAIVPLVYAPETLPEEVARRREIEKYVLKAKDTVGKDS